MARVAILSRPHSASPRVLADSLHAFIGQTDSTSEVFYNLSAVQRLNAHSQVKEKHGRLSWLLYKALHWWSDAAFFRKLRRFDAVIICECCPFAFLRNSFNIDELRIRIGRKPVLYYEVYFLENAPTIVAYLKTGNHHLTERYDWHLAVSEVTEIRQQPRAPWSQIGLYLKSAGLRPDAKKDLLAVVDFEREGHEEFRRIQIQVLQELNIPYVSLEARYTIQEIRDIYRRATFYFIQFREAFGLPIAECLCGGSYVFMPDASWAMSWRLDEHPRVHGPGTMADCFVVYRDATDLREKLSALKSNYDLKETPARVFRTFLDNYPTFYGGNIDALRDVLSRIQNHRILP